MAPAASWKGWGMEPREVAAPVPGSNARTEDAELPVASSPPATRIRRPSHTATARWRAAGSSILAGITLRRWDRSFDDGGAGGVVCTEAFGALHAATATARNAHATAGRRRPTLARRPGGAAPRTPTRGGATGAGCPFGS